MYYMTAKHGLHGAFRALDIWGCTIDAEHCPLVCECLLLRTVWAVLPVGQTAKSRLSSAGNDRALGHVTLNCSFIKSMKNATIQDLRCSIIWMKLMFCLQYFWLNFLFVQCFKWICGVTRITMSRGLEEKHRSGMNGLSIKSCFADWI